MEEDDFLCESQEAFDALVDEVHREERRVYEQFLKPYRKAVKSVKCSEHQKTATIALCHQYGAFECGKSVRIYFTKCCCGGLVASVQEHLKANFANYGEYPVFENI